MGYHWIYSWGMTQLKYNADKPGPIRVWAVEPTSWDHSIIAGLEMLGETTTQLSIISGIKYGQLHTH